MAPLELLPVELQQHILLSLPDVTGIRLAIQAVPALLRTFMRDRDHITRQWLLGLSVPYTLQAELIGLARFSAKELDLSGVPATQYLIKEVPTNAVAPRGPPSLLVLHEAAELHQTVCAFISEYVEWTAATIRSSGLQDVSQLTPTEFERICRAFYRLEGCSLLCRSREPTSGPWRRFEPWHRYRYLDDMIRVCLATFAPWENEQLVCVNDFLVDRLNNSLGEEVANGIDETIRTSNWRLNFGNIRVLFMYQRMVLLGFRFFRQLLNATTYDENLTPISVLRNLPDGIDDLLQYQRSPPLVLRTLDDFDPPSMKKFGSHPQLPDPDPGPEMIWHWTHQKARFPTSVNAGSTIAMRRWGYVMWDLSRCKDLFALNSAWDMNDYK